MHRPDNNKDIVSVRRQAAEGGLGFEAYLPPGLTAWVISLVGQEVFPPPSEAVFVAMQSFQELDDHLDRSRERAQGYGVPNDLLYVWQTTP